MSGKGRSLQLYFIDGRPDGMLTAELFNWTGHILMVPRTQLERALKRKETSYTGVYILIGEENGQEKCYIGQSENIGKRISQHDLGKEWWTSAILVTSAANSLHGAHAAYLESRLVEIAKQVGGFVLDNKNAPNSGSLSEADCANMEGFLDSALMVLPALGVNGFTSNARPEAKGSSLPSSEENRFVFKIEKHGIYASAILDNGEFVVQRGSKAREVWTNNGKYLSYKPLFEKLISSNILISDGSGLNEFAENYAFASPSAAAAVVAGRPSNGQTDWIHLTTGQTYKAWEAERLKQEELA